MLLRIGAKCNRAGIPAASHTAGSRVPLVVHCPIPNCCVCGADVRSAAGGKPNLMSSRTKDTNRSACSRDDRQPWQRRAAACRTSGFPASASLFTLPCALRPSARARIPGTTACAGQGGHSGSRRGRATSPPSHWPWAFRGRAQASRRAPQRTACRRPVPGRDPRRARNPLPPPQQIPKELKLRVSTASPVIKTRSRGLKKQTCPGLWPGVGMHSQSGSPGTPASGVKACAAPVMLAFAAIRAARRGIRRISGSISHRPIGSPYSGRYFPAASGSSPGCTDTGRSQLRASSSAEPRDRRAYGSAGSPPGARPPRTSAPRPA